ncbi:MAG: queuosine precursor transporter [Planctomycetota bacterium]
MPDPQTTAHPLTETPLQRRRLYVLLVMAGLFLGTLAMLNILGISRFIVLFSYTPSTTDADAVFAWGQWGAISFALAVGVLPYPLTFLCTDLISEFYGRRTANFIVWVGLILNLWVLLILWLGGIMPAVPPIDPETQLPDPDSYEYAFYYIRKLTFGAVAASMIAYLFAQFVDVQLFHFWKRLTKGKALWLRNNASTLASQFVDTFAVITITHFYANALPIDPDRAIWPQLWLFILTGYVFKALVALADTPLIYLAVAILKRYLKVDPVEEHTAASGV